MEDVLKKLEGIFDAIEKGKAKIKKLEGAAQKINQARDENLSRLKALRAMVGEQDFQETPEFINSFQKILKTDRDLNSMSESVFSDIREEAARAKKIRHEAESLTTFIKINGV